MPTLGAQILLIAFFIFSFLSQLSVVESRRHRHQISFLAPKAVVAAAAAAQAHLNRAAAAHHLKQRRRKFHANAQEFLLAHNKVRQALGEPPFLWDKKLAHYARRFASKRISDCRMIHSYGPYGENIFWADSTKYRPAEVVGFWIDEHRDYNGTSNMCAPGRSCGHYTQIVWRDSVQLGCALVECNNGGAYGICSYNPPGNFLNESPFEQHL